MARYHFNFRDGDTLDVDDVGIEFENVEEAYLAAYHAIGEMLPERISARRDPLDCAFEITDHRGAALITVPFSEVLERGGKPAAPKRAAFLDAVANARRMKRLTAELSQQLRQTEGALIRTKMLVERAARPSYPQAEES
jgi:hypothetical protein